MSRRNSSPLARMLIGIIMFFSSFVLLWTNEANYVKALRNADFIEKHVISIQNYSPTNNRKLVHYSGTIKTNETLTDGYVSVNAPFLRRHVEMYQWDEYSCKTNDTTKVRRCNYKKVWDDNRINSSHFEESGYNNPEMTLKSQKFRANRVTLGEFTLDKSVIDTLEDSQQMRNLPLISEFSSVNGMYYSGKNYHNPEIGDYRITYYTLPVNSNVSVIAAQFNKILSVFKNSKHTIVLSENGTLTSDAMVEKYREDSNALAMLQRLVGFLLMLIGLLMASEPLIAIFRFIPLLGEVVKGATFLIALIISAALTAITIAISWITVRPLIAIPIIVISLFAVYGSTKLKKNPAK